MTVIAAGIRRRSSGSSSRGVDPRRGRGAIGAGRAGEVGRSPVAAEPAGEQPISAARETTGSGSLPPIGGPRHAPVQEDEGDDDVDVPVFMRR